MHVGNKHDLAEKRGAHAAAKKQLKCIYLECDPHPDTDPDLDLDLDPCRRVQVGNKHDLAEKRGAHAEARGGQPGEGAVEVHLHGM